MPGDPPRRRRDGAAEAEASDILARTQAPVLFGMGRFLGNDRVADTREHLANFKAPRSVRFVDALPRNAGGKVVKPQLRELA